MSRIVKSRVSVYIAMDDYLNSEHSDSYQEEEDNIEEQQELEQEQGEEQENMLVERWKENWEEELFGKTVR